MINRIDGVAVLWIPGPLPSMNEMMAAARSRRGRRGTAYSLLKQQWTDTVATLAREARINKPGPFDRPVTLTFEWVEKNQKRDPDNIASAKKLVLDGLVEAGVLRGDGWKHVRSWWDRFSVNAERPGCGVTINVVPRAVLMEQTTNTRSERT